MGLFKNAFKTAKEIIRDSVEQVKEIDLSEVKSTIENAASTINQEIAKKDQKIINPCDELFNPADVRNDYETFMRFMLSELRDEAGNFRHNYWVLKASFLFRCFCPIDDEHYEQIIYPKDSMLQYGQYSKAIMDWWDEISKKENWQSIFAGEFDGFFEYIKRKYFIFSDVDDYNCLLNNKGYDGYLKGGWEIFKQLYYSREFVRWSDGQLWFNFEKVSYELDVYENGDRDLWKSTADEKEFEIRKYRYENLLAKRDKKRPMEF